MMLGAGARRRLSRGRDRARDRGVRRGAAGDSAAWIGERRHERARTCRSRRPRPPPAGRWQAPSSRSRGRCATAAGGREAHRRRDLLLSTDAKANASDRRIAAVAEKSLKAGKSIKRTRAATVPAGMRGSLVHAAVVCRRAQEGSPSATSATTAARVGTVRRQPPPPPPPPRRHSSAPIAVPRRRRLRRRLRRRHLRRPATAATAATSAAAPPPPPPPASAAATAAAASPPAIDTTIAQAPPAITASSCRALLIHARPWPARRSSAGSTMTPFAPCASPREISNILAGARQLRGPRDGSRRRRRRDARAPRRGASSSRLRPGPEDAAGGGSRDAGQRGAGRRDHARRRDDRVPVHRCRPDPEAASPPDAIEPERASVLRGRVTRRDGSPIGGVRVTVLDHPELGRTATRDDGGFELAVNGGGSVVVEFEREGYVPSQRSTRFLRRTSSAWRRSCSCRSTTRSAASTSRRRRRDAGGAGRAGNRRRRHAPRDAAASSPARTRRRRCPTARPARSATG